MAQVLSLCLLCTKSDEVMLANEVLNRLVSTTVTVRKCAKMLFVTLLLNMRTRRRYLLDNFSIETVVLARCTVMICLKILWQSGHSPYYQTLQLSVTFPMLIFQSVIPPPGLKNASLFNVTCPFSTKCFKPNLASATFSNIGFALFWDSQVSAANRRLPTYFLW